MRPRFRSSWWPNGCISIGPPARRSRCPNNFVHAEWITLHDNSNFRGFVDFLRTELDRVGPAHADLCRDFFSRAVALELSFFEAAYTT
jgi:thiaminase (transcriptional activator TenA)